MILFSHKKNKKGDGIMNQFRLKLSSVSRAKGRTPVDKCRYILREKMYKDRPDLMASGEINIPDVFGSSDRMWKAVEKYERKNAQLYYDIEANLPEGMNESQYRNIVENFVKTTLSEKTAVTYAIHNKRQVDGTYHPHAHIMFSSRQFPENSYGITEKEMFDSRISSKYDGYSKKRYLYFIRKNFADSCNMELVKAGRNPDMKSESYKTLKKEAEDKGDMELAGIYRNLESYKKPHNDKSYVKWIKRRRKIEKELREKGENDMVLSEIQKLSVMDYKGIKRKEYRERLAEHEEKLRNDRMRKREMELEKNPKNELVLFYERVKECNRLYRKSRDFEDISRTKVEGLYASILGEDEKNYKINLPHFISDGELHVNRDVIETRNTKQLSRKIRELSRLEENVEVSQSLSEYSKYITSNGINFAMSNSSVISEFERRQRKSEISDSLNTEIVGNVCEYEARQQLTRNGNTDILERKLRDKKMNEIIHEINERNLANAYLLHRIEELSEKIANTRFSDDLNAPIKMNRVMANFASGERTDIMRNLEEDIIALSDKVDAGFEKFSENMTKDVMVYGRFKGGGKEDYCTRNDILECYESLQKKDNDYEKEYQDELSGKTENEEQADKGKNWWQKMMSANKKDEPKKKKKPVRKQLSESEHILMQEAYKMLYDKDSELNRRERNRLAEAKEDYDNILKNLEKSQMYRDIALEFSEFVSGYDERKDSRSEYAINSKIMANEIAKFSDKETDNTEIEKAYPF